MRKERQLAGATGRKSFLPRSVLAKVTLHERAASPAIRYCYSIGPFGPTAELSPSTSPDLFFSLYRSDWVDEYTTAIASGT
jgi:hypothetical protein